MRQGPGTDGIYLASCPWHHGGLHGRMCLKFRTFGRSGSGLAYFLRNLFKGILRCLAISLASFHP